MRKSLIFVGIIVAGAIASAAAMLYLNDNSTVLPASFGLGQATSKLYLPAKPRKEERILSRVNADGDTVDEVLMRDTGITKTITFFQQTTNIKHVIAYFKASPGQEHGPVMYEKKHDESNHLSWEKRFRLNGSLEADGQLNPDGSYVRHLYYAGAAPSADPRALVVSSEQTFDKWFHPTRVVDYRPDSTKSLVHTWGDGLDEMFDNYAADGQTLLTHVKTGRGTYYSAIYYPDGLNIKVEALNTYQGTTYQWYRPDHTLQYKLTLTPSHVDAIVIADNAGKPIVRQNWYRDFSAPKINGEYQQMISYLERFNAEGNVDRRYDYTDRVLTSVTDYFGDTILGARKVYLVGMDGYPTTVKTYDVNDKDDGGKPVSKDEHVNFIPNVTWTVRPVLDVPKLPDSLNLYGQSYMFMMGH